jgi:hypothetical protein
MKGALSPWLGSVALAQSASLARLHVTTDMPMCRRTTGHRSLGYNGRRAPELTASAASAGRSAIETAEGDNNYRI